MVFCNDEESLGAAKLGVYSDGNCVLFLYGDNGHKVKKEVHFHLDADPKEILKLAAVLTFAADEKLIRDKEIGKLDIGSISYGIHNRSRKYAEEGI